MFELTQHIERLLLENDCVIIPDFGGFITYNNHAQKIEIENTFIPPTRTIGFNPQLKLNDGLLTQSYMTAHDTSFSDASRMIENEVKLLITNLHEKGKVELTNIGELHCSVNNSYEFTPYNEKLTTPKYYGLDSFEIKKLVTIQSERNKSILIPIKNQEKRKTYDIRINRVFARGIVAAIAAIAFFFALSTPIENTYVAKGSYAKLLPMEIFESIESQSVITTPIKKSIVVTKNIAKEDKKEKKVTQPITTKEIKVAPKSEVIKTNPINNESQPIKTIIESGKYHLIVSSSIGQVKADELVTKLKSEGFMAAQVLNKDGKLRVSIMSFTNRNEASKELIRLRNNEQFNDAWLLVL